MGRETSPLAVNTQNKERLTFPALRPSLFACLLPPPSERARAGREPLMPAVPPSNFPPPLKGSEENFRRRHSGRTRTTEEEDMGGSNYILGPTAGLIEGRVITRSQEVSVLHFPRVFSP